MAEEKKPNLKDRLKKTQVGAQNPAAPAGAGAVAPPPGADLVAPPIAPPVAAGIPAPAMPAIPGIPGLSGDVAPPPFVAEQQAQQAAAAQAAARAKAAADDPFAAAHAAPSPQDIRIVVDERPVDDKEVGRSRTGLIVGVAGAALLGLALGFVGGQQSEVSSQGRQTLSALNGVREKAQAAANTLATVKTKVNQACERANIPAGDGEGQPQQAAAREPQVDMDLVNWFRTEGGENAPFGPDVFAARMGRLTPEVSQKIAAVHVMFAQLWRDLGAHAAATGNGEAVTESMRAAADSSAMTLKLGLIFKQPQANAPWVGVLTLAQNVNPQTGQVTLAALNGIPEPTRPRSIFTGAQPINQQNLPNTFVSVNVTDGLGPSLQRSSAMQWMQYRSRLMGLRNLVNQLDQAQQGLMNKLTGRRG
jgi:hypothetical protein